MIGVRLSRLLRHQPHLPQHARRKQPSPSSQASPAHRQSSNHGRRQPPMEYSVPWIRSVIIAYHGSAPLSASSPAEARQRQRAVLGVSDARTVTSEHLRTLPCRVNFPVRPRRHRPMLRRACLVRLLKGRGAAWHGSTPPLPRQRPPHPHTLRSLASLCMIHDRNACPTPTPTHTHTRAHKYTDTFRHASRRTGSWRGIKRTTLIRRTGSWRGIKRTTLIRRTGSWRALRARCRRPLRPCECFGTFLPVRP